MKRGAWKTRFGFYMAAIGTAFGLGNLWRFPYVVGSHGGGAFVLLYVGFALTVGLSILIAELILGKFTHQGMLGALKKIGRARRWTALGTLSLIAVLVALSYYAVISGWVLHFLARFLMSLLFNVPFSIEDTMRVLMESGPLQMALTSAHMLIIVVIVAKGVQDGIERWVGFVMPIFILLMIGLLVQSLLLPSAPQAVRFLFYPDFSQLKASSLIQAMGHVLFTLSMGFGTMVVFGSYLSDETHIPSAGFKVALIDVSLSLLAGLLIFPIVFSDPSVTAANLKTGPELLFETIPRLFQGRGAALWGSAFFLCLYLAAVGASIGLLEASVSNLMDLGKIKRSRSTWTVGIAGLLLAIFPALSSTAFREVRYRGMGLLALIDAGLITVLLPVIALGVSLAVGLKIKKQLLKDLFVSTDRQASMTLFPYWTSMLKWAAPLMIAGCLLIELVGFFLSF